MNTPEQQMKAKWIEDSRQAILKRLQQEHAEKVRQCIENWNKTK